MRRTKTMLCGELLDEFFKRPYIAAKVAQGRLPELWQEAVGARVASLTSELRFDNGVLYVKLQSSLLCQELFYQREALKERLNELAGVRFVNVIIVK